MRILALISLCFVLSSANSYALTLQETIKTAFDINPITKANDSRLAAAEWEVRGVKRDRLPQGFVNYTYALDHFNSVYGVDSLEETTTSKSWNIGISYRIYDGGEGRNRVCVAQKNYEALKATNSSTNALIPDTLGSLAQEVFEVYIGIAQIESEIEFLNYQKNNLEILLKYAKTEDQKNELRASLDDNSSSIMDMQSEGDELISDYEGKWVMAPLISIDKLESVAESLIIPKTAEEAIEIGMRKKPEIRIAQARLEAAQCGLKAHKAQANSLKADVVARRGSYQVNGMTPSGTVGNSLNLIFTKNFSPSQSSYIQEDAQNVNAAEQDLEKEFSRLNTDIKGSLYPRLDRYAKATEKFRKSLVENDKEIQEILKKLQNHEAVDYDHARSVIGRRYNLNNNFGNRLRDYVKTKFDIQKKIGILFESTEGGIQLEK